MIQDKLKQALINFIDTNSVLIISSNKAERSNFRKVFSDIGVSNTQIKVVGTFTEAKEFIKNNDTQFIFAQDFIDEESCEDFLIEHIELQPDRSNLLFFIQATDRRHALISQYEEKYVDNIFYNPVTIVDLTNTILDILKNKIKLQKDDFYKNYWKLQSD